MKTSTLIAGLLFTSTATTSLALNAATVPSTCAAKAQEIQQQLDQARHHKNSAQVRGLEKALASVQTHCNDGELRAKQQAEVTEKQAKVAEREQELQESLQSGADADKIQKRRNKLSEAQQELQEAQRTLASMENP